MRGDILATVTYWLLSQEGESGEPDKSHGKAGKIRRMPQPEDQVMIGRAADRHLSNPTILTIYWILSPTVAGDDWKRTWGRAIWPSKGQTARQESSRIATWDHLDVADVLMTKLFIIFVWFNQSSHQCHMGVSTTSLSVSWQWWKKFFFKRLMS